MSIKDIPLSATVVVIITVVYSLYFSNVLKNVPCGGKTIDRFNSNFVHTDFGHLIKNIFSLYAISRLEVEMGSKDFFYLFFYCLTMNSILESYIYKKFNIECGIGLSGILYSLTFWDIYMTDEVDYYLLGASILSFIQPIFDIKKKETNNIDCMGHFIGIFVGVISAISWKVVKKVCNI